jgi:hypothetical protein
MTQKTFTVTVYSDPAHAWAKVKKQVLLNLGIADKISRYSYQLRDNVYLEEDCDLYLLHQTLDAQDVRLKYVEKHTDKSSKIRSYERYEHGRYA